MLRKITLKPGLDKQSSDTGAESRWVNGDYMRFRYSYPEKIGGWQQLTSSNLVGAGRDQHAWVDNIGNKYVAAIDEIIAVIIKVKNCPKDPGRYVF